jgi:hypothetical protein
VTEGDRLAALEAFFERYRRFRAEHIDLHVQELAAAIRHLGAGVRALRDREVDVASRFNVFRVLGLQADEVKTHSAFLKNLLDPRGTHAQGPVFVQAFVAQCQAKTDRSGGRFPPMTLDTGDGTGWTVDAELWTRQRRLDLVLRHRERRCAIAIENKVGAPEGEGQLARYAAWLATQDAYTHRALVYLTLDGKASQTDRGASYYCLSYRDDITTWLRGVLSQVRAERVRDVITQYLDAVENLVAETGGRDAA